MWHMMHTAMTVTMMTMHCVTCVLRIIATMAVVSRSPSFVATSPPIGPVIVIIELIVLIIVWIVATVRTERIAGPRREIIIIFIIVVFIEHGGIVATSSMYMGHPSSTLGSTAATVHIQRCAMRWWTERCNLHGASPPADLTTSTMTWDVSTIADRGRPVRTILVPDVWPCRIINAWFSSPASRWINSSELTFTMIVCGKTGLAIPDVPLRWTQPNCPCKPFPARGHVEFSDLRSSCNTQREGRGGFGPRGTEWCSKNSLLLRRRRQDNSAWPTHVPC